MPSELISPKPSEDSFLAFEFLADFLGFLLAICTGLFAASVIIDAYLNGVRVDPVILAPLRAACGCALSVAALPTCQAACQMLIPRRFRRPDYCDGCRFIFEK